MRRRVEQVGDWLAWFGNWCDYWLRPPVGRRRELWDTSLFLFGLTFVGYVLTKPTPAVAAALSAPLQVVTETQLGWGLVGASLIGVAASYGPARWIDWGYTLPRIGAWFMMLNFLSGILLVFVDLHTSSDLVPGGLTDAEASTVFRSAFLYALIYGWAARRLGRDNRAWWER